MSHPFILGLTGSIGMGKSTVALMFTEFGVPVFDADAAVHRLQGPGGRLLPVIEAAFPGTTGPNGVDRPALGAQVFANRDALTRLESIVHPAVETLRKEFLLEHAGQDIVLFDIPLLFEKGGWKRVDAIVVVSAPPDVQRRRVLSRAGMSPEKFAEILKIQTPDSEKQARADYVIDTGQSLAATRSDVARLVQDLRERVAQEKSRPV